RVQEACDAVYWRRILRGSEHFSWKKLGAFGAELTALAAFFDRPWDQPSRDLSPADQAWILNEAGFFLRALGRLGEAVAPMRATLEINEADGEWRNAAVCASNLSELLLTLGQVAEAVAAGEESVALADRSEDAFMRMVSRTVLADALHGAGRWEESAALFREAEGMQADWQKEYPRLYSLGGYRYCDLLLSQAELEDGAGLEGVLVSGTAASGVGAHGRAPHGSTDDGGRAGNGGRAHGRAPLRRTEERAADRARYREACEEVRGRATQTLEWVTTQHWLLDIALDHLSLGRAHLGLALTAPEAPDFAPAAEHLDRAVEGLRQAAQEDDLPRGLLARAAFRRLTGNLDAAAVDVGEALEIAERGGMRLHQADAHLEWTRLHLQQDDPATARTHLASARELVTTCGYGRRLREVRWLAGRVE
ncbi:MAG TPA: tetratricopeptide repeat protein, partial [Thermoanaerobaculia bacterium]|nr:tetratricopeptide repeat protein [Thermoanaerobaculia bacterium]